MLPPACELTAFDLVGANGALKCRPKAFRCRECSERPGADGAGFLCVLIEDGAGNTVLCYYHSKGTTKNGDPRGRWVLSSLPQGAKARIVCDFGHRCDVPLS